MPTSPKADIGPKSYAVYKSRARKTIRFFVDRPLVSHRGRWRTTASWYVLDMDTGTIAARTKKEGYPDRKDAVRVAREHRDEYGAYTKAPF